MPTPIVVPKLNENDDEVVVVELADGYVAAGQALFSVETSKAVQEVEAETAGFVLWFAQVGDRVDVLAELGWIFATEEERDGWSTDRPASAADIPSGEPSPAAARPATEPARRLAAELGVSLYDVPGTGIVRESDVRAFAEAAAPAEPAPAAEEPSAGRLSDELRERLRADPASIAALPSDEKVALYREHGAVIGEQVTVGSGVLIDAQFVEIGSDTSIGDAVLVRVRRFTIGELGRIGAGCRFLCRDVVAGDVVTLGRNVAVADEQGGSHDCRIGDLCFVAHDTYLNTDRDVTLGERVCVSPGAHVYTQRKWLEALDGYPFSYAPVSIGERSWLGPGSLVLPGVVIDSEVTVMANSVVASNAPRGALLGGVPATVVKARQQADLDVNHHANVVREIFEGNREALSALGWTVEPEDAGDAAWAGRLFGVAGEAQVIVEGRTIIVGGTTVFDLDARTVSGTRNAATDVVRHLLFKYGHSFEPRLWRLGARLDETTY
jgi:acetyltransferase-like isoleucine patch superfamily enzyme